MSFDESQTLPDVPSPWRQRLHEIIFEADTRAGKAFDVALIIAILASVFAVMMESAVVDQKWRNFLWTLEWIFTILFTVEYVLRLICVARPVRYARSFFGVVDLLSILPTYISLLVAGSQSLLVIRTLRLLRVFRIFKLARFVSEARAMRRAIWQARAKVIVFLYTVLIVVTILGTAMHLVESAGDTPNPGFNSIPKSMYWAVITMTTVGYGDTVPRKPVGKLLTCLLVLIGYSLIIVPTGIVSAEMVAMSRKPLTTQACPHCMREGHDADATHCKYCGQAL